MLDINYYMQTLNPFDKLKMKSRYKRGAFMNDELQGDSREYKEAARMYNHDLKEYYRQHNYQVMPEEEEENEEIKVIPLREGRNGNPSEYLSALGLKGNEAATVVAQPLRLLKGVDTLSDNKALSRISLSGNKASSSSYPSVRLAQGYGRNIMSDTPIRLAQSDSDKLGVNWIYDDADSFVYGGSSQPYTCDFFMNSNKIYKADKHRSKIVDGPTINAMAERLAKDKNYLNTQKEQAYKKCLEANKSKKYCDKFADSIFQCYKDALDDASQNKDFFDKTKGEYKENYFKEFLRSIGILL